MFWGNAGESFTDEMNFEGLVEVFLVIKWEKNCPKREGLSSPHFKNRFIEV